MAKRYSSENKIQKTKPDLNNHSIGEPQQQTPSAMSLRWTMIPVTVLFVLLLALAGSMDNTVEKWVGLLSAAASLALLVAFRKRGSANTYRTPVFLAFTAYVIWGGISTFYAASGKFAIFEFSKLLFALCIFLIVVFFSGSKELLNLQKISYVLASAGAFFGVISIDAASAGLLSRLFKAFLGLFTEVYASRGGFEQGIRITGIFGNPNIYAGFMAIAVFFSLYLTINAANKKNVAVSSALLAINALSYLLAFSLGSLFMFVISCLIMIGMSEKEKRAPLFILMAETAVLAFVFAFLSMSGLGKTGALSFVPLASVILNALLLYLADSNLRPRLQSKLDGGGKLSFKIVLFTIVVIAAYMTAAFTISSDLSLADKESVMRAAYLSGGEYSLTVNSSAPVSLRIESQNETDLIRHTSSRLFTGTNQKEISFTVPDDSKIVLITLTGGEGGSFVYSAQYSGASQGDVHMKYPLLPNIIANRLQNIFANENMVQRGIFFEDGIKMFSKSPVIGRGLGGFENGVYGVQDFYYETKYAHNHYIQVLSDLGIVGLVLFLSIIVSSVLSIIRSKQRSRSLFAIPLLSACVFQSFGQAVTDATWSAGVFLGFTAAVLALLTIYCGEPIQFKSASMERSLSILQKGSLLIFTGAFIILLSGNLYAQAHAKAGVSSFDDIERLIILDRFEYNDYKVSYIVNAPKSNDKEILAQADIYAKQLMNVSSNSIAPYVMAYNFETYKDADAFKTAIKGIENAKSSPYMWMKLFDTCEEYIDPVGAHVQDAADRLESSKYYIDSVLDLYNRLIERNQSSLDQISLSPSNNAFIGKLLEIKATNLYSVDWTFTAIMTYAFDSECAVDTDQNGIPDSISVRTGSISRNEKGDLAVSANTTLDLNLYHKLKGNYTFNVSTSTPEGIKVLLNGEESPVVYESAAAYTMIELPDNSDRTMSKFTVTFPQAAVINEITYTTKLEM